MALIPCSDLSPAGWITASTLPWHVLATFGPAGFPAHARLRFIPDPVHPGQAEADAPTDDAPTETELLGTALGILARHTGTPDDCYFALWDGWGSDLDGGDGAWLVDEESRAATQGPQIAPAFPPAVLAGPKLEIPNRAYYLFRGKLSDFGDWGADDRWPGQPRTSMPCPAFMWPADHAWCIASDVDPHWAGIGAGTAALEQLLATPNLDAVRADPLAGQPAYH